ncbi:MAG: glycosyltransferase family 4 protein [Candidatus Berkiellales bacterium]
MSWISYLLVLFGISWSGVGMYRWHAISKGFLDHPSARSSHFVATPRGGGIVFALSWNILLGVLHYYGSFDLRTIYYFLPSLLVAFVGYWDDRKGLSPATRLSVQAIAAISSLFILAEGGDLIHAFLPQVPLPLCFGILVGAILWMINLYNFMDGSDGLAAMEGMFVFLVGGAMLYQVEAYELAVLAFGLVALLGGFLAWNWPNARIFMGDSGSYFLGFVIALFALLSYKQFQISLLLWFIITALFWFDATITLLRRILAKENFLKAHRSHAYQRLIQKGWSHQQVLFAAIGVNIVLSILTVIAFNDPRLIYFALGVAITFLFCLYILVEIAWPMSRTWYEA